VNLGLPSHGLGASDFGVVSPAGPACPLHLGTRVVL
jgi:hypothetical protein